MSVLYDPVKEVLHTYVGAVGPSGRTPTDHRIPDGRWSPSTKDGPCTPRELRRTLSGPATELPVPLDSDAG